MEDSVPWPGGGGGYLRGDGLGRLRGASSLRSGPARHGDSERLREVRVQQQERVSEGIRTDRHLENPIRLRCDQKRDLLGPHCRLERHTGGGRGAARLRGQREKDGVPGYVRSRRLEIRLRQTVAPLVGRT